jgi:hypothetical protein
MELVFPAMAATMSCTFLLYAAQLETKVWTSILQIGGVMLTSAASTNPKQALQMIR